MSLLRRIELMDPYCLSPLFLAPETLALEPYYHEQIISSLDLLGLEPSPFDLFDTVTDLIQLERTPFRSSYRRIQHRVAPVPEPSYLPSLSDRVAALESKFDRLVSSRRVAAGDRKYTWTAEIKGEKADRKYKLITEINGEKGKEKHHHHHHRPHHHHKHKEGKSYKWTAEIKEKGEELPVRRTYTWEVSNRDADESSESGSEKGEKKPKKHKEEEEEKKKNNNNKKKERRATRLVEIEEANDHGTVVLRQAFAKAGALRASKGKKKELSPQDAAMLIQMSFKAYLVRRSRALRALRELAVAKAKLKEIRTLFNNFSYRRRIARDAEELQRFTERVIVLLLTVDAIEGVDLMVRTARKSMVDELEAMLDVVDPQPAGRSLSIKRRTFDVPDGVIQKEIAEGVTQIVKMLEEEEDQSSEI